MGPLEAMVFLDASCYFWTRRGISARVHNERAAGRAGGRTGWQSYFWTRRGISVRVHNERAAGRAGEGRMAKLFLDTSLGGRAGGQAAKVISGHVFSKIISGHVSGRAGGRTSCQSYFWTRLQQNYTSPGGRAGGQAGKVISGRVLLFLDASWYFCTRSSRAGDRAGGRAREGWQNYFWTRLRAGGAGGQAAKVISGHVFRKIISGHVSGRAGEERLPKLLRFCVAGARFWNFLFEKLRRPRTKCSFWKFVAWKVEEASHEMLVLEVCCLKSWRGLARNARLEVCCLKSWGGLARNAGFGKLVAWKVEEASHETLVLEACPLKSWGGLARNARFESLLLEKLTRLRTKC